VQEHGPPSWRRAGAGRGGPGAVGFMAWVTEAEYVEHSVCARWLSREPPPLQPPRSLSPDSRPHDQGAPWSEDAPAAQDHPTRGQHSQLTWEEHAWYLRSRSPEQAERLSPEDAARLRHLHAVVAAEQAAFRAQRAAETDVAALLSVHPRIHEQVRLAG
jgi:hypothetical protein